MTCPMPTNAHLWKAREAFTKIEPRDFFYRSVTKLVSAILDDNPNPNLADDLVPALMMLLTTWNKNYYRFFEQRNPGTTLAEHFDDLEKAITKHFDCLLVLRQRQILAITDVPEKDLRRIFDDFATVLGRVGAAKCLHLLGPDFFPLWDAAILKGYGLEKGAHRHSSETDRYIAFMHISRTQIERLNNWRSLTSHPLKLLDEYNYCRFTKMVSFT